MALIGLITKADELIWMILYFFQLGFHRLRAADLTSVPTISEPQEVLDMEGHIVGIALDPSGRYLHVNVRHWPQGAAPVTDSSMPIAEDIQMRVLDLQEKR